MAGIIAGVCVNDTPKTGQDRCPKSELRTIALLLSDPNARLPYTENSTELNVEQYVTSGTSNRLFPINDILENTISGNESETSDTGAGYAQPIGLTQYVETYRITGSDCLFKEIMKFNGRQMRVFRVDTENYMFGTVTSHRESQYFTGFSVVPYARQQKQTGSDISAIYIDLYYSVNYENELKNKHAVVLDFVPNGLVGVELKAEQKGLKVVASCSGVDYTELWAEEWDQTMFINSSGTAATTVTYNQTSGTLTISPAGAYRVADGAVLSAGGVTGLTGNNKTVTV